MIDFIVENYYVILVICILLIFAIIGYIIDSIKNQNNTSATEFDTYVPDEEVFIQKFEEKEEIPEEESEDSVDDLLEEYNSSQNENNSK